MTGTLRARAGTCDGVPFARIDTPGAVFGEMSVVLDRVATATVRAGSDVEVYAIAEPLDFLRDQPGAALAVLRLTAARLDGLTQYLVDVKSQYADRDDHLGMVDGILDALGQSLRPQVGPRRHRASPDRPTMGTR